VSDRVKFNKDNKFDLQLEQALIDERRLAEIFENAKLEKVELKSEQWQWEQTGNICIEFRRSGKPSGIAVTEADTWVHHLKRDGRTLMHMMIPMERMKELCRDAYRRGDYRLGCGDGNLSDVVLLRLRDLLR
jgi:hypothetical protein